MTNSTTYALDENGLFNLHLDYDSEAGLIEGRIDSVYGLANSFVENVAPLISVDINRSRASEGHAAFRVAAEEGAELRYAINGQPMATFQVSANGIKTTEQYSKLSVFETRSICRTKQTLIPQAGREPTVPLLAPITDLHTHLSGQVTSADLMEIGLKHDIAYPIAPLIDLGIKYTGKTFEIPKRVFLPLKELQPEGNKEPAVRLSQIAKEDRAKLAQAMNMSILRQDTYPDMEYCYYLREPFTKNIDLFPDMLRKVAEDYKRQGIKYAELSTNALIDPKWLEKAHEVVPQIEKDTEVKLRFLVGLPRNLTTGEQRTRIEKLKKIAVSQLVVGGDVLGLEVTKTSDMHGPLRDFAAWIRDNAPDFILRIHAGENSKNPANVREALELAHEFGIRTRIGHALFGVDEETTALARALASDPDKGNLIVEFNPDSNLACDNIDFADEVPAHRFISAGIPSVLSSDGAGLYMTTSRQTAMAGHLGGMTPEDFAKVRKTEESYIELQQQHYERKKRDLPENFFETLKFETLDEMVAGRQPILIAGAAGNSWKNIDKQDRAEIARGIQLMLETLDPSKVCFVSGRTKKSGVGILLAEAVANYNKEHDKPFDYFVLLAQSDEDHSYGLPGVTQVFPLPSKLNLASDMIKFIKEHDGMALFAGGNTFTRNFVTHANRQKIDFGLMKGPAGAAQDKIRLYPQNAFVGAEGMFQCVKTLHPEWFLNNNVARFVGSRGGTEAIAAGK